MKAGKKTSWFGFKIPFFALSPPYKVSVKV